MTASLEITPEAQVQSKAINLPLGLLGFETVKRYQLLSDPNEAPFQWLQMGDDPNQGFLVLEPAYFIEDYAPQISDDDVRFLGLQDASDALILNIVTIRSGGKATANLKGPIVINRHTLVGKQVIPTNAAELSVGYALPTQ